MLKVADIKSVGFTLRMYLILFSHSLDLFSELLGFDYVGELNVVRNKVAEYKDDHSKAPRQAEPFKGKKIRWLEEMVMDKN